jgi:breast cancer 2 susceptibility protein
VLNSDVALRALLREGCRLATARWVDNHWSQILWKIAGQIQAQPNLYGARWNWTEIVEQLKYRYEREIGSAQRPIIRRIQEHDSSAAVPMVLIVSAIRRSGLVQSNEQRTVTRPFLELTDGWYRINAEIDDCLARAVDRGRIRVGRKLAVCGAKV